MSIHMFHHKCDKCGTRGEEYCAFPSCRECMDDLCHDCAIDFDAETNSAICQACINYERAVAVYESGRMGNC